MTRVKISSQAWGVVQSKATVPTTTVGLFTSALIPASGVEATLKNADSSPATWWTAATGGSSSTSSLTASPDGELPGFIDPGQYLITVGDETDVPVEAVADLSPHVAVLKEAPLNIKDSRVGGTGGGANHDTALSVAKTLLPARGGDIFFPPDYYTFSSPPNFDGSTSVRLLGAGGSYGGAHANQTLLEYTGTGTFLSAKSSYGFTVENLYLYAASLGASGVAINLDRSTTDTVKWSIRNCWIRGTNNSTGILVSLTNAHSGDIGRVLFHGAARAIRGTTTGGGADFSNAVTINNRCYFQYQASAPILNPNLGWTIEDCVFEPTQSTTGLAGAIEVASGHAVKGLNLIGNTFQDSTGGGTWVSLRGDTAVIEANTFFTGAKFIEFIGAFDSVGMTGNRFGEPSYGASTAAVDFGSTGVTNLSETANHFGGNTADMVGVVNADVGGVIANDAWTGGTGVQTTWPAANRCLAVRYVPEFTHTATGVAFHCGTADAGTPNGDVGIIDRSRNRLASSGSVSMVAGTGIRYTAFTSPIVLRKGQVYYVCVALASSTAVVEFTPNFSTGTVAELISGATTTPHILQFYRDTAMPIPDPLGAPTSSRASVPILAVRTA